MALILIATLVWQLVEAAGSAVGFAIRDPGFAATGEWLAEPISSSSAC